MPRYWLSPRHQYGPGTFTGQSDTHLLEAQSPAQELSGGWQLHCTANLEVSNLRFAQRREGNEILFGHFCENGRRKEDCLLVKHALPQRDCITSRYSQVHVPLLLEQRKFSEQQLSDLNSYGGNSALMVQISLSLPLFLTLK